MPKQNTTIVDDVDGITYIASQTYVFTEEEGFTKEQVIAGAPEIVCTLVDGCITFPVKSLCLQWPEAPADSKYDTDPEGWYIGNIPGALLLPGGTYVDPWTLLGEATFTDNLLAPSFNKTVAPYSVNVYKSNETEGLYKVENPWKGLYGAFGFNSTSPDIELDASQPDNVLLDLTSTGINGGSDGVYYIFSYSAYMVIREEDPSTITADERITLATTEEVIDGDTYDILTFEFGPNSGLLFAAASGLIYYAGDGENVSTIVIKNKKVDGVNDISAATAEGPAKYYNLQGVEVTNPAKGSVVIRVQGGNATKVLTK